MCPIEGREVEQHLTLTRDGRVWLTRYAFAKDLNYIKYKKTEQVRFKIHIEKAAFVLDMIKKYFRDEYEIIFATDVGTYEMWVDDDEGERAYFTGPLVSECKIDGYDLSQLVRDTLNDQTLFVFDGNLLDESD